MKNILNVSGNLFIEQDIYHTLFYYLFSTLLNIMTNQEIDNDLMTDIFEPLVSSGLITLGNTKNLLTD